MAFNCPGCGRENVDGARFCQSCGITITRPSSATLIQPPAPDPSTAPTTSLPTVTPIAAPAYAPPPPSYTPPALYQQPVYQQPVYQQPVYQQPVYQQPAYPTAAVAGSQRSNAFYVGAVIVLVCGLLILASTFLAWMSLEGYGDASISGWDTKDAIDNGFFDWGDGKPLFSGYCSLIAGGVITLLGALVLATRSKGLAGVVLVFFLISLVISITNAYSILSVGDPGYGYFSYSLGAGMYLFLAGSVGGTIGSIVCMAG